MRRALTCIGRNQDGVTVVEFGLVAPVFLMALIGMFEMSYNIYTASILTGSIQKAARDSTIEGASVDLDNRVTDLVQEVVPSAQVSFQRTAYTEYADINQPENFTDTDGDGSCNNGEPFEDVNGNGIWDSNRGEDGLGGARDAVLYVVTVEYDRQFPLHAFIPGLGDKVTTVARTVLRNQPYAMQDRDITVGNC